MSATARSIKSDFEATVAAATNEAEIDVAVDQAIQAVASKFDRAQIAVALFAPRSQITSS